MFRFKGNYFIIFTILLLIEVIIAVFIKQRFIRGWLGDFLVVIMIYCFLRSLFKIKIPKAAIITLILAYFTEWLQHLNFVKYIHLAGNEFSLVVLGHAFSWLDIIAYTAGILFVVGIEYLLRRNLKSVKNGFD